MRTCVQQIGCGLLALGLWPWAETRLNAQTPATVATPPALRSGATTNAPRLPPMPKSPVESFRELLAMRPSERESQLTNRPPEIRRQLLQKIREYEAMAPEVREATLKATQLHWYLDRYIPAPATSSLPQFDAVPAPYRQEVSNRVNQFRLLPPALQRDVLNHPTTAAYFLGRTSNSTGTVSMPMPPLPPPLAGLRKLPAEQRRKMYSSFESFFDLSAEDKQKVLARLPDPQRPRVEEMLQALERLSADQRKLGLQAIDRMLSMTEEQRRELMSNAAQWKQLPAAEREAWLKLVPRLPPVPPPPSLVPRSLPPMATNQPN